MAQPCTIKYVSAVWQYTFAMQKFKVANSLERHKRQTVIKYLNHKVFSIKYKVTMQMTNVVHCALLLLVGGFLHSCDGHFAHTVVVQI